MLTRVLQVWHTGQAAYRAVDVPVPLWGCGRSDRLAGSSHSSRHKQGRHQEDMEGLQKRSGEQFSYAHHCTDDVLYCYQQLGSKGVRVCGSRVSGWLSR